jgi:putative membrane protein
MADRNFVTTAAAGGMFEVEASKLAAEKATDPAVKAFASMLVEDHTKVNDELQRLASTKNVTLPSELPTDKKEQLKKLQSISGAAFDRRYVQEIGIKDHLQDIRSFEKASRDAKDPQVKAWAQQTLPKLRDHYAKAQTLPGGGEKEQTTGRASSTYDGSETRGGVAAAPGPSGAGDAAGSMSATPPPPTR